MKLPDPEDTTLNEVMKHSLESSDISSIETDTKQTTMCQGN